MELKLIREIVGQCGFPDYTFEVEESSHGYWYLQAHYLEEDVHTGVVEAQFTRRWMLSPKMTKSEVVQTAFKCALTSMEHKTREHFTYEGRAVFGPHFDVDALWSICHPRCEDRRDTPEGVPLEDL